MICLGFLKRVSGVNLGFLVCFALLSNEFVDFFFTRINILLGLFFSRILEFLRKPTYFCFWRKIHLKFLG